LRDQPRRDPREGQRQQEGTTYQRDQQPVEGALVMQEPRPRPLQPSSAGSTTKDTEERKKTTNPIIMDLTPKDTQQTTLATLVTPGTEGPRESATMTTETKTP
jgi:hypothetical protein